MALYIKSGIFKVSDSFFGVNIDVNMITGEHAAYFLLYFVLGYFCLCGTFRSVWFYGKQARRIIWNNDANYSYIDGELSGGVISSA